jgi:hypothetical protein
MSVSLSSVPINAPINVLISALRNDNDTKVIGRSPRSFYHGFYHQVSTPYAAFYIIGIFGQNMARTLSQAAKFESLDIQTRATSPSPLSPSISPASSVRSAWTHSQNSSI